MGRWNPFARKPLISLSKEAIAEIADIIKQRRKIHDLKKRNSQNYARKPRRRRHE